LVPFPAVLGFTINGFPVLRRAAIAAKISEPNRGRDHVYSPAWRQSSRNTSRANLHWFRRARDST